jgi:hypothetical protein
MKHIRLLAAILVMALSLFPAGLEIPSGDFAEGWQVKGATRTFNRNGLYGHINGGSELFLEFGFDVLTVQRYGRGDDEVALEAYKMTSPEAALGIYLMKCGKESPVEGIPGRHTGDAYQLMSLYGNYLLVVNNYSGKKEMAPVMRSLLLAAQKKVDFVKPADVLAPLPTKGRIAGSERLIRGMYSLASLYTLGDDDILLLKGEIFGAAADYQLESGGSYTRIVIVYPGKKEARGALAHLKANLDSYLTIVAEDPSNLSFKDYQGKFGTVVVAEGTMTISVNLPKSPTS